ncbi:AmmeMemoRadiSam system protein A, partial [Faecalibaculum rodentium]
SDEAAGVFVSVHKDGQLRGCIGTTEPVTTNVTTEIMQNAVSAVSRDPRFPAVQPWELEDLDINVDVLMPAEVIDSPDQLDVKKYGVIVSKGGKRGLLLPDLEGVDTVEKQLEIAKQKAGLSPQETGCTLQRFEVVRHK